MMTLQNGIIGDDYSMNIPETELDPQVTAEIQQAARFSKTKEWKQLKEYLESRITFYQAFLPDGRAVGAINDVKLAQEMWIPANVIIGEFVALMGQYEQTKGK